MKFKAFLTDNGVNLLEQRILPALDKMGKICHLYPTRDHTYFLHNLLNGDGVQSISQFRKEAVFEDYRISSKTTATSPSPLISPCSIVPFSASSPFNLAAMALVGLIQIASKLSWLRNCSLIRRSQCLFFTFETNGYKSAVIQDVPISKPLSRADMAVLQAALDSVQEMPRTLVKVPDMNQLEQFVNRMKHVGEVMNVSISKYGDLHLHISTSLITLGLRSGNFWLFESKLRSGKGIRI